MTSDQRSATKSARVVLVPSPGRLAPLDYRVPAGVVAGMRVLVPLGNRRAMGVVIDCGEAPTTDVPLRDVIAVLDDQPVLDDALLGLVRWMADYYGLARRVMMTGCRACCGSRPSIWVSRRRAADGRRYRAERAPLTSSAAAARCARRAAPPSAPPSIARCGGFSPARRQWRNGCGRENRPTSGCAVQAAVRSTMPTPPGRRPALRRSTLPR